MKDMVEIVDHRGGTIMKTFQFIPLLLPFSAARKLTLLSQIRGGGSVIKIPSSAFGERGSGTAAELVCTN